MKNLRLTLAAGLAAIALLAGGGSHEARAVTECSTLLATQNADNVTLNAGLTNSCAGQTFHPMGVIGQVIGPVGTATGTTLQTLGTITLSANTLDAVGRRVHCHAAYHFASNVDNKTITLQFGGGASTLASPTAASNNVNGTLDMDIVKSGASTQQVTGQGLVATTPVTPLFVADTQTDTSAINILAQATDGTSAANDTVLEDFYCQIME